MEMVRLLPELNFKGQYSFCYKEVEVNGKPYYTGMYNHRTFGGKTQTLAFNDFCYLVNENLNER